MGNILLCSYGDPWQILVSSSLLKTLGKQKEDNIYLSTSSECAALFQYNEKLSYIARDYEVIKKDFDLCINLSPTLDACSYVSSLRSKKYAGFMEKNGAIIALSDGSNEGYKVLVENRYTSKNVFQVYYKIAEMTWRGEGYDLSYFPKNKTKKKKTGLAIRDDNLRYFVKTNLMLSMSEIWHIPMKNNILKRIDEINKCKNVVTDDMFTLHAAIALRKHVEFLDTDGFNMDIEFFGNGTRHKLNDVCKKWI